jgi:dTDP-4-dehydrorhamnose reductase
MRILVFGSSGILGTSLLKTGGVSHEIDAPSSVDVDCRDFPSVEERISDFKPQVVVNACAIKLPPSTISTMLDGTEYVINVKFPEWLASLSSTYEFHLVHASSDSVFGESQLGPFDSKSEPLPSTVYGKMKREAEERILSSASSYSILRFGPLFGLSISKRNTIRRLFESILNGKEVSPDSSNYVSFTDALTLSERVLEFIVYRPPGIFHFSARSSYTWWHVANEFAWLIGQELLIPDHPSTPKNDRRLVPGSAAQCDLGPLQESLERYVRAQLKEFEKSVQ